MCFKVYYSSHYGGRDGFKYNFRQERIFSGQGGFTLLEMMVVIVIIGIFTAALSSLATQYLLEKRKNQLDGTMSEIRSALTRYISDDPAIPPPGVVPPGPNDPVRYPCPASLSAVPGGANFGTEIPCPPAGPLVVGSQIGASGVWVAQGSNGQIVLVGAVPTSTLGIASSNMIDPYKNRLTYAVSWDVVQVDALANPVQGAITVVDGNDAQITNTAAFTIISHGVDGTGSYTASGVLNGNSCNGMAGDSRNCAWRDAGDDPNQEAIFRSQQGFTMANNANYFDDETVFTLSSGLDDGWWAGTDQSGTHIKNKNPGNVLMAVDPGTSVGIGTMAPDPAAKLHVNGEIRASAFFYEPITP